MTAQLTTSPVLTLAAASAAHSRRISGGDVVGRVADEDGIGRAAVQPGEGVEHGLGIRLVRARGIETDDVAHEFVDADAAERALGGFRCFARHEGHLVASLVEEG